MHESAVSRELDAFIQLAKEQGFEVRHELLGGIASGICEVRGKRCLFLDPSCGSAELLDSVKQSLAGTVPTEKKNAA